MSINQNIIHWIITCFIWGIGSLFLIKNSSKKGFSSFSNKRPTKKNILISIVVIIFSISVMYFQWDFKLKPIAEYEGFIEKYNSDRKSTRLNSSHANISYAVFC